MRRRGGLIRWGDGCITVSLPIFWRFRGTWGNETHNRSRFGYTWVRIVKPKGGLTSWAYLEVRVFV